MLEGDDIRHALSQIHGAQEAQDIVTAGRVQGVVIKSGNIGFSLEVGGLATETLETLKKQAEEAVAAIKGVLSVTCVMTAHKAAPAVEASKPAHKPASEPNREVPEVFDRIGAVIAVASGKGGVGKSTVSSNLAVALAKQGRRVGLLDADIYGPSQPRMMGVSKRPASPDGKVIIPLQAHGVTVMSIGLMVDPNKAVVWRGPMLMGALQQMLNQVQWGELDVLIIDLPPGTGDVQLTLCQKTELTGAIVVSTPQDVALLDARKALDMFATLHTPVLGMIENMSQYMCPKCGHEAHIFGHGGVELEAQKLGLPFLGSLPLDLSVRLAGDSGTPAAAGDGPMAQAYAELARRLIASDIA